ncbi:hypothetical protein ACFW88_00105 [Streptomyces anandii]|uniref:Uncharacterized protein n=1 Tax=Streptomyces anandii TaxID=285454 RepID=A0ABW6GY57_9ACTN
MAQVAPARLWRPPAIVAPVIGATKPHHPQDALAALDVPLDEGPQGATGCQPRPTQCDA